MFFTSSLLSEVPGLRHGFGSALEPIPQVFGEQIIWDEVKPKWKQVHGTKIVEVVKLSQELGETDAMWTRAQATPLACVTADCVPIIMAKKDGTAIATIHAGWRGTHDLIPQKIWKSIAQTGERPENWVAALGPSIGPCCYEVSTELAQDFLKTFAWISPAMILPNKKNQRMLDLQSILLGQLESLGIQEIDVLPVCTRCSQTEGKWLLNSFRRDGTAGRQFAVALISG